MQITYNQQNRKSFQLMYAISPVAGSLPFRGNVDFSKPAQIYQNNFRFSEGGEYQALFIGKDGKKQLVFCDWSDYSRARYGVISN